MMIGSGPTLYIIRYFQGLTIEWRGHRWCEVDFGGWNWWWKHDDVQCLVYRGHWMGSILGDIKKRMAILRGFALQHALFGFWLCNDPWYIPRERSSNHQGFHGRHENLRGRTVTVYFLLVVFLFQDCWVNRFNRWLAAWWFLPLAYLRVRSPFATKT